MNSPLIWIIDDDPFYSTRLGENLSKSELNAIYRRFEIGCFASSELTHGTRPDAVILDLMMPYDENDLQNRAPMDYTSVTPQGIRIVKDFVSKGFPASRIIVISALDDPKHKRELEAQGILESRKQILIKPIRGSEILSAIRLALQRR